ncbi:MAG: hypothetical protein V4754_22115 [Pseudomonadota bacterium]
MINLCSFSPIVRPPSPRPLSAPKKSRAENIAADYAGENVSGKDEKKNIDASLAFFDEFANQPKINDPKKPVDTYISGLMEKAAKVCNLELLKSFVAVHDCAKMNVNLRKIGKNVTDENKTELYSMHDAWTEQVMSKVYGFSKEDTTLFNHPDVRSVVDCFDVLGNSSFLRRNASPDRPPLIKDLLEAKSVFDSVDNKQARGDNNIMNIAKVLGVSGNTADHKNVAEAVFKKQFCINDGSSYKDFKKEHGKAFDQFLGNLMNCRKQNIVVANPRELFRTLGYTIPQVPENLKTLSHAQLAEALSKFNDVYAGKEVSAEVEGKPDQDGNKTVQARTVSLKRTPGNFTPNRFHYPQTMELFCVPKAKVEGDILPTAGSISF